MKIIYRHPDAAAHTSILWVSGVVLKGSLHLFGYPPGTGFGYILYQLLRLLGKDVQAEEFNTLKTLDLAITNDTIWSQVCNALGWKFLPTTGLCLSDLARKRSRHW